MNNDPVMERRLKIFGITVVLLLVSLFYGNLFAVKINLVTADIGRHLENGKLLFSLPLQQSRDIFFTNLYSYTSGSASFVNHHWLSGIVYYLVFYIFGFIGLSYFNILLGLGALLILLFLSGRESGWLKVFLVSVFISPVIASRVEVRPEFFTYLFFSLYFFLLWRWNTGRMKKGWLYIIPFLGLIWVNLHIGFVFGWFLLGVFGAVHLLFLLFKKENKFKEILPVGAITFLLSFINPNFIKGAFYPFFIFGNYGYTVVENQSIKFLENIKFMRPDFLIWKIGALVGIVFLVLSLILKIKTKKLNKDFIIVSSIWIILTGLSYLAIRNFAIYGLFSLFAIPYFMNNFLCSISREDVKKVFSFIVNLLCIAIAITGLHIGYLMANSYGDMKGVGLTPGVSASAEFFQKNNLKGPIFNNYDVGGYLIYNLYPTEKVFTDNRPEAYLSGFFDNTYKSIQTDPKKWKEAEGKYGFNVIFFSHRDYTPWGQAFLTRIIDDPEWAPVFVDNYVLIFLKRNSLNQQTISKFEIPRSNFSIK